MRPSVSLRCIAANLALFAFTSAQTADQLSEALRKYDDLSLFRSLLSAAPQAFQSALSNKSKNITVLVPTNDAITTYLSNSGLSDVSAIDSELVKVFFSYQTMSASLKSSDFDSKRGMAVPTLLNGEEYDNRTAGAQLKQDFGAGATGQVVFTSSSKSSGSKRRSNGPTVTVRGGLAQEAQMTVVDGTWGPDKANSFQIVDSVLIPPKPCSVTIRSSKSQLSGLDVALNRTELWPQINTTPNVTCLAPSTEAFRKAGNPQESLSKHDLTGAIFHHTLNQVAYSNYLEDGMVFGTLNGTTLRVRIKGDDIYFNNAKVIEANVLTNNGLIHVLDAVINTESDESSSTSTASSDATSSTSSSTSAPSSTNAASARSVGVPGLVALAVGLVIM